MPELSYWFIINPVSGSKQNVRRLSHLINSLFSKKKYQIKYTEYPGHASKIAAEAANRHIDIVAFAGGDGTLNETATGLVHTNTALGIIPRGSGNGFARSLGIPLETRQALELLLTPAIISIDAAKINDGYFFGVCGVGFDAVVGSAFQQFGHRGPLPYFYIGIREFFKYTFPEMYIETEEQTVKVNPLAVTIANTSEYGNGAQIAPAAEFTDGLLDVCILKKFSFFEGLAGIRSLFNGKIADNDFYQTFRSAHIRIINNGPGGLYHVDGEPKTGGEELEISVLPKALKVVVNLTKNNQKSESRI